MFDSDCKRNPEKSQEVPVSRLLYPDGHEWVVQGAATTRRSLGRTRHASVHRCHHRPEAVRAGDVRPRPHHRRGQRLQQRGRSTTGREPDRMAASRGACPRIVLGSIAQGAPFVLVAAELERRGVGTNWLAAVAAVRLAPYLLCSPVAGALAGRYEARTVFAVTGLARAALIAALWIALSAGSPPLLLVSLLFVLVAVGTPTFPALMRAVRQRAPHAQLDRTSAVAAGLESAAFVAGPALGGLLLLADTTDSLLVCAAIMVVSATIASFVPIAEMGNRPAERTIGWTPSRRRPMPARSRSPTGDRGRGGRERARRADGHAARPASGRARLGRRTRLRTALVRFRGGCVRRVRRAPPPRPAWAATRPAGHRRCGSRRARRDQRAVRRIAGLRCPRRLDPHRRGAGDQHSRPCAAGRARRTRVRRARRRDDCRDDQRGSRRTRAHLELRSATDPRHRRRRGPVAGELCPAVHVGCGVR